MGTQAKRETLRVAFTKKRLEALGAPDSGRVYWHDERCAGLTLCVTDSGRKTFYYYRWAQGRPQRKKLGRFPAELTVEQARDLAKTWAGKFAAGEDPIEAVRTARKQPTLGDAWQHFEQYGKEHKRPKSRAEDKRYWETFLKPWAGRRLAKITRAEVQGLHSKVGSENGPYRANRLLALTSTIFNKAADIGYSGGNPARGIKRFKEQSRDRFLKPDELKPFFTALMAEPNETLRDFFVVALFTGARRSNCQAMRWEDLDLNSGYWRIPPEESKGGEAVILALSPAVAELLKRRKKDSSGSPWVFASKTSKTGHITEPKAAWKRIVTAAGLQNVRPHDLRRTLGSWQALLGASETLIGKTLGHAPGSPATAVYSRLTLDPVRQSVNGAEAAILQAGKFTADLQPIPEETEQEGKADEHE